MLHIKKLEDGAELFKTLGSDIRIHILRLLLDNQTMSMNEIAQSIGVSNGALTSHVKKLEETGLIKEVDDPRYFAHSDRMKAVILFTPDWWFDNWNQYGLLKVLSINKKGTYIGGLRISDVNVKQLNLDYKSTLKFEFAVDENGKIFVTYSAKQMLP